MITWKTDLALDTEQKAAVDLCCDTKQRIVGITGQAGTGKTTILRVVYDALTYAGYRVALCAPTGKAAKRIQEATGIPARTAHALLEFNHPGERDPKTGKTLYESKPKRTPYNPLEYDVVLADEYSMATPDLHRYMIDALPPKGCLRAFGDMNQLPPIVKGKELFEPPFKIVLEKFAGVVLKTNHRQDEGSGIARAGARILLGQMPPRADDFRMEITDSPVDVILKHANAKYAGLTHQIIVPGNKGWIGTLKLNGLLQTKFHPHADYTPLPRHKWSKEKDLQVAVGDKVIMTTNHYDLRQEEERFYLEDDFDQFGEPCKVKHFIKPDADQAIFNGEMGLITAISDAGEISIDLGDRVVTVPPELPWRTPDGMIAFLDPRMDIELGYAVTTHKAQGSEYEEVIYAMTRFAMYNLCRSNFYTGIMRARKCVTVVTDQKSLSISLYRKEPPR